MKTEVVALAVVDVEIGAMLPSVDGSKVVVSSCSSAVVVSSSTTGVADMSSFSRSVVVTVAKSSVTNWMGSMVQDTDSLTLRHSSSRVEHSQYLPAKESAQLQEKLSTPSMHCPPLKHLQGTD